MDARAESSRTTHADWFNDAVVQWVRRALQKASDSRKITLYDFGSVMTRQYPGQENPDRTQSVAFTSVTGLVMGIDVCEQLSSTNATHYLQSLQIMHTTA